MRVLSLISGDLDAICRYGGLRNLTQTLHEFATNHVEEPDVPAVGPSGEFDDLAAVFSDVLICDS